MWSMELKGIPVNIIMAGPDWSISYFLKGTPKFSLQLQVLMLVKPLSQISTFSLTKLEWKLPDLRTLSTKSFPYWTITTLNIRSVLHWSWWCCLFKVQPLSWFHTVHRKFTAVILNTFSWMQCAQDHLKFKCFQLLRDTLLGTAISGPGGLVFCSEKDGRTNKISSSFSPESCIHFCAQPSTTLSICHNCIHQHTSQCETSLILCQCLLFLLHLLVLKCFCKSCSIIVFLGFHGSWWIFLLFLFYYYFNAPNWLWERNDLKLPFSILMM